MGAMVQGYSGIHSAEQAVLKEVLHVINYESVWRNVVLATTGGEP